MIDVSDIFFDQFQNTKPLIALKEAIAANEDKILDLNRQQLDRGQDSQGRSLGRYANFKYKNRFEPVDLKLTGDFRNKFSLQIDDKQTEIFSQDVKEEKLKKRYGKEIFGISNTYLPNMQGLIEDDFVKHYQQQLLK